jgi:hypothetical protein
VGRSNVRHLDMLSALIDVGTIKDNQLHLAWQGAAAFRQHDPAAFR